MSLPETGEGHAGRALCDGHIVRLVSPGQLGADVLRRKISSYRFVGRVAAERRAAPEWPAVLRRTPSVAISSGSRPANQLDCSVSTATSGGQLILMGT